MKKIDIASIVPVLLSLLSAVPDQIRLSLCSLPPPRHVLCVLQWSACLISASNSPLIVTAIQEVLTRPFPTSPRKPRRHTRQTRVLRTTAFAAGSLINVVIVEEYKIGCNYRRHKAYGGIMLGGAFPLRSAVWVLKRRRNEDNDGNAQTRNNLQPRRGVVLRFLNPVLFWRRKNNEVVATAIHFDKNNDFFGWRLSSLLLQPASQSSLCCPFSCRHRHIHRCAFLHLSVSARSAETR